MTANIEIIEDNAGGLTIQNTATKAVAHFGHKSDQAAIDSLKEILDGGDMSGWDLSDPECYITDDEYSRHASSGGYRIWDEDEIREHMQAAHDLAADLNAKARPVQEVAAESGDDVEDVTDAIEAAVYEMQ